MTAILTNTVPAVGLYAGMRGGLPGRCAIAGKAPFGLFPVEHPTPDEPFVLEYWFLLVCMKM